jgi:hypothetical protein
VAVSKRLRYEILRRDNHACRYCGKAAPETELRVDHVIPVALGGTDDPSNLVTACEPCNTGKTSTAPDSPIVDDVSADALRWGNAIAEAANALLLEHDRRKALRDEFFEAWCSWTYMSQGRKCSLDLPDTWGNSVDSILSAGLPIEILCECINIAMGKKYLKDEFRYMCGIAWRKVSELRDIAAELVNADEPRGKHQAR